MCMHGMASAELGHDPVTHASTGGCRRRQQQGTRRATSMALQNRGSRRRDTGHDLGEQQVAMVAAGSTERARPRMLGMHGHDPVKASTATDMATIAATYLARTQL